MWVFSFDDGMVAESWYAAFAFRNRVSMSAIGSVIVMASGASLAAVPHAPGLGDLARGLSAIGGAWVSYWNGRRRTGTARLQGPAARGACRGEQPGPSPAGLAHAGQLPGVGHLPQADAAQAELAEDRVRPPAPLAAGVAADRELRLAGRLVDQSLLGHLSLVSCPLSGSYSRRSGRRGGPRADGAARDPPRRSWRW